MRKYKTRFQTIKISKLKKFNFSEEFSDENRFLQFSSIFVNFKELSITKNMRSIEYSIDYNSMKKNPHHIHSDLIKHIKSFDRNFF